MYWNFGGLLRGPRDARFSRADGGLVVEIGFGNGEYLAHLAGANPDSTAVGIEVSQWCIAKAARRALAMGLLNVRLLHGDARYLLCAAFEPECVRAIYMNFPCPWPKKKHAGRRVATPDFARLISSRLFPGGTFTLATDVGWYAEETREIFAGCAGFEAETAEGVAGLGCGTKYERKWSSMGRDTHMVVAKKTGPGEPHADLGEQSGPEWADGPAPEGDLRAAVMSLSGETVRGNGYMAVLRDVFLSEDGDALISAISVDEGFEQHYYLRVVRTKRGVRCMLDPVGHPYMTPGVRASIRHAAREISRAAEG